MEKLDDKADLELVKMYIAGCESGLIELLNRYKSKIYTAIHMQVKDDYLADDIFQETFIKVISILREGRYDEQGKFLSWVVRIAQNMVIDYFRKESRGPSMVSSESQDIFDLLEISDEDIETKIVRNQISYDLTRLIQLLPDEQKEVLIMRQFCDMTYKEISDVSGISINTALGRMRYALVNLRRLIEDHKMTLQMT